MVNGTLAEVLSSVELLQEGAAQIPGRCVYLATMLSGLLDLSPVSATAEWNGGKADRRKSGAYSAAV
jgi:hypothetical protein